MKAILILLIPIWISSTIFAQAPKTIIVTTYHKTVPAGKKWVLNTGSPVRIQVEDGVYNSGSMCNALFTSNPKMVFNINIGRGYNTKSYGLIFKSREKTPYTNDYTFDITPIGIIDKNFSVTEFQQKPLDEIGIKKLEIKAGEEVFVGNCLESIEFVEVNMTAQDALDAKKESEVRAKALETQNKDSDERAKALEAKNAQRKQKIKETQSKIYDLEKESPSLYQEFLLKHKRFVSNAVEASEQIPSYTAIRKTNSNFFRIKNIYSENLKLKYASADGKIPERDLLLNIDLSLRLHDLITTQDVKLLSGIDTGCEFIRQAIQKNAMENVMLIYKGLPALQVDGISVLPQATISNLEVDFSKGISKVLISDGKVTFKKYPPPADIQEKIAKQIINKWGGNPTYSAENGLRLFNTAGFVRYEVCTVMGESFIKVDNGYSNEEFDESTPWE